MCDKVDFDTYSDTYTKLMEDQHRIFGDIDYYSRQKVVIAKERFNNKIESILEFGCGIGKNLGHLSTSFPNAKIFASDISEDSLKKAKLENPSISYILDNKLGNYKESFDMIFIAGVFHHIEPSLRKEINNKLFSLLKKDGQVICFEHNPYNPLTRHMVNTCEFDEDAVLLRPKEMQTLLSEAGLSIKETSYTLFVPPKLAKLNFIERYLKWIPLGGQYYIIAKK